MNSTYTTKMCKICLHCSTETCRGDSLLCELVPDIVQRKNDGVLVCSECYKQLVTCCEFVKKIRQSNTMLEYIDPLFLEKQLNNNKINVWRLPDFLGEKDVLALRVNLDDANESKASSDGLLHNFNNNISSEFTEKNGTVKESRMKKKPKLSKVTIDSNLECFVCSDCSKKFKRKSRLIRHVTKFCPVGVDLGTRRQNHKIICELCGKRFLHFGHMKRHLKWHSIADNFTCDLCLVKFQEKGLLDKHMLIHTRVDSVECNFCHKWFLSNGRLGNHIRKKHPDLKEDKKSGNSTLMCAECGKLYQCPESYKRHKLLHTEIKNFCCTCCGVTFYTNSELVRHRRYKHEEDELRKHKCIQCNITFVEGIRYKIHMRKHAGDRAFVCEVCKKSYFSKAMLSIHTKKKHGQQVNS